LQINHGAGNPTLRLTNLRDDDRFARGGILTTITPGCVKHILSCASPSICCVVRGTYKDVTMPPFAARVHLPGTSPPL
jgi:hypothetical protein